MKTPKQIIDWMIKSLGVPDQGSMAENIELLSMVLQSKHYATQAKSCEFDFYVRLSPEVLYSLSQQPPDPELDYNEYKLEFLKFHRGLPVEVWAAETFTELANVCHLMKLQAQT